MAQHGFLVDIAAAVCDFLGAGNIASGRILYTLDFLRGVEQAVRRAGIEPDKITVELDYMQLFAAHILQIDVRNLKLTACGRLQIARNLYDTVVIEVQTRNNIVRLRIARLLLDGDGASLCIELNYAERTRIIHIIAEYAGALTVLKSLLEIAAEFRRIKDVVAEYKADIIVSDKLRADQQGVRNAARDLLYLVGDVNAETSA